MTRIQISATWDNDLEDYFTKRNIYLAHPKRISGVYKKGETINAHMRCEVESYGTLCRNSFFNIGAHSFAQNYLRPDIRIGRYCSIASGLEVMAAQHPIDRFTTSPITYLPRWVEHARNEYGADWHVEPFPEDLPAPIIGNDVWIGQQVLLKGGITIGDGAVVASRAVVTRDVEPYMIVGGIPARVIRPRFGDRHIGRLLAIKWWRYRYSDLPQEHWSDIEKFLDALQERIEAGKLRPWDPGIWNVVDDLSEIILSRPR